MTEEQKEQLKKAFKGGFAKKHFFCTSLSPDEWDSWCEHCFDLWYKEHLADAGS